MIYLFWGDNAYAKHQASLELIEAAQKKSQIPSIERFDGESLDSRQLGNILQGVSLFSTEKLVVISEASKNKVLWNELEKWAEAAPEGTDLLLIETAPDRRTKTFKLLQKHAVGKEYKTLAEPDAIAWLREESKKRGGNLTLKDAEQIVTQAGNDQWRLSNELDKLLAHGVSKEAIKVLVESTPQANAFALLDAVLHKKRALVEQQISTAKATEDPYMLFGLLGAQLLQLAALVHGQGRSAEEIAKTLGTHPFPLKKLTPLARSTSSGELKDIIEATAMLDTQLKSTGLDPWLLLEQTLMKIVARS